MLKELLKHTDPLHQDYHSLKDALERVQRVAEIINERKRDSERFNELIQVQGKITGAPITIAQPERTLLKEGDLIELADGGKRKLRHVFLFNDTLICTQLQKSRFTVAEKVTYEYRWMVLLADCTIGPVERRNIQILNEESMITIMSVVHVS
jgi:hypothetical protein